MSSRSIPTDPVSLLRGVLLLGGLAMLAWAGWLVLTRFTLPELWPVARWAVGAVVLHDALVAPAAVVIGWVVLRRAPARWRAPLRAALLSGFCVVMMGLVLLGGRAHQQNPTTAVNAPWTALVVALVLVPVVAGAVALVTRPTTETAGRARTG